MTHRGKGLLAALAFIAASAGATAHAEEATMKSVTNGEATISYYAQGEGPLILFIASTGRGTEEFGLLAERLAERGYRVLRPEPRGVGESKGPMEGVSFHDFADDFAAVIRNEGEQAIVAGHAYGNWIARTIASDHPELTRGVVLVAAGAKEWPKELSDAITMINDPASTREQRLEGLRLAFFAEGSDPTPWLEGWHQEVTRSQRAARKLTNREDWWAGGTAPMLDLQGGSDPFRPASSRQELKDEFGDRVTVKVIEGASHALPAEKPTEVADAIADWADQLKN
ncbi:alpha/beta hydrolase [Chelativorans sp. AA-79]|uniref:alpha/beta fold hydrolase n=1 Tax=Chelativorans sp. AA-79 TaxID=3028735 RepID=UPI0023FA3D64|nr:alpha/beta hydrolase [Chelativorans sp. AA-79]WEX08716.1 alpha/beta hydrolase [Chelativorans sp. AA-79]